MDERKRVEALVALEKERSRIRAQKERLEGMGRWLPAAGLRRYAEEIEVQLGRLAARMDAKPIVAVVGPTGAGKSTLVNALAGAEALVRVGEGRPTTRRLAVVARTGGDAGPLLEQVGGEELEVLPYAGTRLPDALVVDTPDTNSGECRAHEPLLQKVLGLADVLVCVFNVHNPKERDNIVALAGWVDFFPGEHVYLVLNRCDRVDERELRETVVPDFLAHISASWRRAYSRVFVVSARGALPNPGWAEPEGPLHGRNELEALRGELAELGGRQVFVDQRLSRARYLHDVLWEAVRREAAPHVAGLRAALAELAETERKVADTMAESVSARMQQESGGLVALLCSATAQRWGGPVGLFLGLWRRLVDFWTPMSVARALNPLMLPMTVFRALRAATNPEAMEREMERQLTERGGSIPVLQAKQVVHEAWPPLADALIGHGFDPAIRSVSAGMELVPMDALSREVWGEAMSRAVEAGANRLSRRWWQFVMNLPSVAVLIGLAAAFVVWPVAYRAPLPRDVYPHAAGLLLLTWLLPSWWVQHGMMRKARKLPVEALQHAKQVFAETRAGGGGGRSLRGEIERVVELG